MKKLFARFAKEESGATAIEYALIAVGIALVVGAAALILGNQIAGLFGDIGARLAAA